MMSMLMATVRRIKNHKRRFNVSKVAIKSTHRKLLGIHNSTRQRNHWEVIAVILIGRIAALASVRYCYRPLIASVGLSVVSPAKRLNLSRYRSEGRLMLAHIGATWRIRLSVRLYHL